MGLINDLSAKALRDTSSFRMSGHTGFISKIDTVIGQFFLRTGDRINIEEVDREELRLAEQMVSERLNNDTLNIAFYHYDTLLINRYGQKFISEAYDLLH